MVSTSVSINCGTMQVSCSYYTVREIHPGIRGNSCESLTADGEKQALRAPLGSLFWLKCALMLCQISTMQLFTARPQ